jgi:hypothetical protein
MRNYKILEKPMKSCEVFGKDSDKSKLHSRRILYVCVLLVSFIGYITVVSQEANRRLNLGNSCSCAIQNRIAFYLVSIG